MDSLPNDSPLKIKIQQAPQQPGCYLFADKLGNTIYVGKAKNLRSRVKSYFTSAATEDWRTAELVPRIADVEYRATAYELDALLLEYKLIKQYKPWHNSQMKADELRPFLRVSADTPYPTLSSCQRTSDDGATYFDFFVDRYDIERTLSLLGKAFGLPQCGKSNFSKLTSPCILHSTSGCLAPCAGKADAGQYAVSIREALRLLSGKSVKRLSELKREMRLAADALAFEKAAQFKDLIDGLTNLSRKSRLRFHLPDKGSVLVLIRPYREPSFAAFIVTDGIAISRSDFPKEPSGEMIAEYTVSMTVPNIHHDDSVWLTKALTEVGAFKQFVSLPDTRNSAKIAEAAIRKFAELKR